MSTAHAKILVWNERGYSTETCIVYSEKELQERIRYYLNRGYVSAGEAKPHQRHIEVI